MNKQIDMFLTSVLSIDFGEETEWFQKFSKKMRNEIQLIADHELVEYLANKTATIKSRAARIKDKTKQELVLKVVTGSFSLLPDILKLAISL